MFLKTKRIIEDGHSLTLSDNGPSIGEQVDQMIHAMFTTHDIPGMPHAIELVFSEEESHAMHEKFNRRDKSRPAK